MIQIYDKNRFDDYLGYYRGYIKNTNIERVMVKLSIWLNSIAILAEFRYSFRLIILCKRLNFHPFPFSPGWQMQIVLSIISFTIIDYLVY